jgi:bla regulator protein BlaR1
MLCILYVTAIGLLLGTIGVLAERLLPAWFGRRWIWCATMATSIVLPGYYRFHHVMTLDGTALTGSMTAAGLLKQFNAMGGSITQAGLVASVLMVAWAFVNAASVSRRVSSRPSATDVDGIAAVVTDSLGPATIGIWGSRVILPKWVLALPVSQRRYVVRHEEEHRRAHDCALLFVASVFVIVTPWNVALWWQLHRLRHAVEMDCDRRVVSALGNPHAYASLLLTVAHSASRGPRLQPALLGGRGMLERRLSAMLAPSPLRGAQRLVLPLVAAALLAFVLAAPHPMLAGHTHAPDVAPSHMTP